MSINMAEFASKEHSAICLIHVQCVNCGYEPEDPIIIPSVKCPKCHGSAWEQFAFPSPLVDKDGKPQLQNTRVRHKFRKYDPNKFFKRSKKKQSHVTERRLTELKRDFLISELQNC